MWGIMLCRLGFVSTFVSSEPVLGSGLYTAPHALSLSNFTYGVAYPLLYLCATPVTKHGVAAAAAAAAKTLLHEQSIPPG